MHLIINQILQNAQCNEITKIDLRNNYIGDDEAKAISEALKINKSVTKCNNYKYLKYFR